MTKLQIEKEKREHRRKMARVYMEYFWVNKEAAVKWMKTWIQINR